MIDISKNIISNQPQAGTVALELAEAFPINQETRFRETEFKNNLLLQAGYMCLAFSDRTPSYFSSNDLSEVPPYRFIHQISSNEGNLRTTSPSQIAPTSVKLLATVNPDLNPPASIADVARHPSLSNQGTQLILEETNALADRATRDLFGNEGRYIIAANIDGKPVDAMQAVKALHLHVIALHPKTIKHVARLLPLMLKRLEQESGSNLLKKNYTEATDLLPVFRSDLGSFMIASNENLLDTASDSKEIAIAAANPRELPLPRRTSFLKQHLVRFLQQDLFRAVYGEAYQPPRSSL